MIQKQVNATEKRFNGLAIASLLLGFFWLLGLGSVLAVIFGIIALKQINQSKKTQKGQGLAVAGIALGLLGIVIIILLVSLGKTINEAVKTSNGSAATSQNRSGQNADTSATQSSLLLPEPGAKGVVYTDYEGNRYRAAITSIEFIKPFSGGEGTLVRANVELTNITEGIYIPEPNSLEFKAAIPTQYLPGGSCATPYIPKPGWCMASYGSYDYAPDIDFVDGQNMLKPEGSALLDVIISTENYHFAIVDTRITRDDVIVMWHDLVLPHDY